MWQPSPVNARAVHAHASHEGPISHRTAFLRTDVPLGSGLRAGYRTAGTCAENQSGWLGVWELRRDHLGQPEDFEESKRPQSISTGRAPWHSRRRNCCEWTGSFSQHYRRKRRPRASPAVWCLALSRFPRLISGSLKWYPQLDIQLWASPRRNVQRPERDTGSLLDCPFWLEHSGT